VWTAPRTFPIPVHRGLTISPERFFFHGLLNPFFVAPVRSSRPELALCSFHLPPERVMRGFRPVVGASQTGFRVQTILLHFPFFVRPLFVRFGSKGQGGGKPWDFA